MNLIRNKWSEITLLKWLQYHVSQGPMDAMHASFYWNTIGSDNGLSPVGRHVTLNDGLLLIWLLGTNFNRKIKNFHSRKYVWKYRLPQWPQYVDDYSGCCDVHALFLVPSFIIVPLKGLEVVALHGSEGVHNVGAEVRVDILWLELALAMTVLRPVGVITHSEVRRDHWKLEQTGTMAQSTKRDFETVYQDGTARAPNI